MTLCAVSLWNECVNMASVSRTVSVKQKPISRNLDIGEGNYFVPSLSFRVRGESTNWDDIQELKTDCDDPVHDLQWEWYPQLQQNEKVNHKPDRPRLLIGLYAGFDPYAEFLQYSSHLAKVYAHRFPNVQVVVLQGTAFAPRGCKPPGFHTTLNKVRLLFHAIDHASDYDQLLLLDADALLVNMDEDITSLLDVDTLVAAQPIDSETDNSHLIVGGATLWNLHHPLLKDVALEWFSLAKEAIVKDKYHGDQKYLQGALKSNKAPVKPIPDEFSGKSGRVVQHYTKTKSDSLESRLEKVQISAENICEQYPIDCSTVPRKRYPTK